MGKSGGGGARPIRIGVCTFLAANHEGFTHPPLFSTRIVTTESFTDATDHREKLGVRQITYTIGDPPEFAESQPSVTLS